MKYRKWFNRDLLILLPILGLAFVLRFVGIDWDQGQHLHPDERFLTMVLSAMKMPTSWAHYLDPASSSLNPRNIGYDFFVYGSLPLVMTWLMGLVTGMQDYGSIHFVGRHLSALMDIITLLAIYGIARELERAGEVGSKVRFFAVFAYATSVLAIQLAHFFTVDQFLNAFIALSMYAGLLFARTKKKGLLPLMSIFLACAMSSKLTGVYGFVAVALALLPFRIYALKYEWRKIFIYIPLCLIVFYVTLRVANPILFQHASWLDVVPSAQFLSNIAQLKSFDDPNGYFPPAIQWMSLDIELDGGALRALFTTWISISFGIVNGVIVGWSPAYALCLVVGLLSVLGHKKPRLTILAIWVIGLTAWFSLQFVKVMRYYFILYPAMAIFIAIGLDVLWKRVKSVTSIGSNLRWLLSPLMLCIVIFWPLAFMGIYFTEHSRVQASRWIYNNVPNNATILWELWDDPLPLVLPQQPNTKSFDGQQFEVFNPDDEQKWDKMIAQFQSADYYIMSSNRGWGSITKVPEKYPIMSFVYRDLLNRNRTWPLLCNLRKAQLDQLSDSHRQIAADICAAKLEYRLVKTVTSYPNMRYLGLPIDLPDQWTDEAFTVYDHPKVMIFAQ